MRRFLLICALTALCAAYWQLPKDWKRKYRKMACEDYCGGESKSSRMGFDFVQANWELCSCTIFPKNDTPYREAVAIHAQWTSTICYKQCLKRCRRTRGKCAINSIHNKRYQGQCCTKANKKWKIMAACFVNGTGACYSDGQGPRGLGGFLPMGPLPAIPKGNRLPGPGPVDGPPIPIAN